MVAALNRVATFWETRKLRKFRVFGADWKIQEILDIFQKIKEFWILFKKSGHFGYSSNGSHVG